MKTSSLFYLLVTIILIPLKAMEPAEMRDLSPESTIEAALALCYLPKINDRLLYKESPPIFGACNTCSNFLLVCPVRKAGIDCFCRSGHYKDKQSLTQHIKALAGAYRCSLCKTLLSGKYSLEIHNCAKKIK